MPSLSHDQRPLAQLRELGATCGVSVGGSFFGLSRPHSYRLVQQGEFPVPVLRVGSRMMIRTADLARALGVEPWELLTPATEPTSTSSDAD